MVTLLTTGQIARLGGVELHRVEYMIRSRKIKPAAKAGVAWVYDHATAEAMLAELKRGEAGARSGTSDKGLTGKLAASPDGKKLLATLRRAASRFQSALIAAGVTGDGGLLTAADWHEIGSRFGLTDRGYRRSVEGSDLIAS